MDILEDLIFTSLLYLQVYLLVALSKHQVLEKKYTIFCTFLCY